MIGNKYHDHPDKTSINCTTVEVVGELTGFIFKKMDCLLYCGGKRYKAIKYRKSKRELEDWKWLCRRSGGFEEKGKVVASPIHRK